MKIETIEALKSTGITKNQRFAVMEGARTLTTTETQIVDAGKRVTDRVERALQWMAEGTTLNELGELQSSGSEFDRLISVRAQQATALKNLIGSFEEAARDAVFELVFPGRS